MNQVEFTAVLIGRGWQNVRMELDVRDYITPPLETVWVVADQAGVEIRGCFGGPGDDVLTSVNVHQQFNFCLGAIFEDWSAPDYSLAWAQDRISPVSDLVDQLSQDERDITYMSPVEEAVFDAAFESFGDVYDPKIRTLFVSQGY